MLPGDERDRVHDRRPHPAAPRAGELIEEALADLPGFILERQPRVMFENAGHSLLRWLMFGRPPNVEWLQLSAISYYVLTERYVDVAET